MQPFGTPGLKRPLAITLTLLMLISFSTSSYSQKVTVENSPAIKVKYLQGSKDALLFNLKYDNLSGNDFNLMVIGEGGEVLYQKSYSGKKLRKKIRLTRLTNTGGVIFLIRPAKEDMQLSCAVKVPGKVEDERSETEE